MTKSIACCFHPTTVLMVDDSMNFLKTVTSRIRNDLAICLYANPWKALSHLNEEYQASPFTNRCLQTPGSTDYEQHSVSLDILKIADERNHEKKFESVSVLVADFVMPEMSGLQLFDKIEDASIRKILLTGEADTDLAVKAFNQGSIDYYISKGESDLQDKLLKAIAEEQQKYFSGLSTGIVDTLIRDEGRATCLAEPVFSDYLDAIIQEKNIVEYYLIDHGGSFLLIDDKQKHWWLVARTEVAFKTMQLTAETADAPPPKEVMQMLVKRKQQPFFHNEQEPNMPPSEWSAYMHPVQKIKGKDPFYCSLIEGSDRHPLKQAESLKAYSQYIESLEL